MDGLLLSFPKPAGIDPCRHDHNKRLRSGDSKWFVRMMGLGQYGKNIVYCVAGLGVLFGVFICRKKGGALSKVIDHSNLMRDST